MHKTKLSTEQINAIIRMAWEDRTSFEVQRLFRDYLTHRRLLKKDKENG